MMNGTKDGEESDDENTSDNGAKQIVECEDKSDQTEEDSSVLIVVGKMFSSFADLERGITLYEEKNFVKFWKREAHTIKAARKRVEHHINPELKYTCIHGGQKFRLKGKENRNTS